MVAVNAQFGRTSLYFDNYCSNDPTAADDSTLGYVAGSRWFNTGATPSREYVCTSAASGAAVWQQVMADGTTGTTTVVGGNATIHGGDAASAAGGTLLARGGDVSISGAGGAISIRGGAGASTSGGGALVLEGGPAVTGAGGAVSIIGGAGTSGSVAGGNIYLAAGASVGSGVNGHIIITNLGTADPSIKGALYAPAVAGAVSISGG